MYTVLNITPYWNFDGGDDGGDYRYTKQTETESAVPPSTLPTTLHNLMVSAPQRLSNYNYWGVSRGFRFMVAIGGTFSTTPVVDVCQMHSEIRKVDALCVSWHNFLVWVNIPGFQRVKKIIDWNAQS
jgi:hypothetical protein